MNGFNYANFKDKLSEFERENAPEQLYMEGNYLLLSEGRRVSVVGTRKPTNEGIARTEMVTKSLVENNIIVVSGLAEGVDTIAHRTAINNSGKTISVLGTPLDIVSPVKNKSLLDEIKKYHLAISQFESGSPVRKQNFPFRNRTMALISDATIIIEAGEDSGTKHQGWEALRLNRMLFLLENVVRDKSLTWPKKMIEYGAQILTKDNIQSILNEIPSFNANVEFDC